MRLIYAYTKVYPEAVAALDAEQHPYEMVDVSEDDYAYYRLREALWRSGEDHLVVEHDIVIPPGSVAAFLSCSEPWCALIYWMPFGNFGAWFGAARFRGSLTKQLPGLPDEIVNRHWGALDSAFINHLRLHGYPEAHRHGYARHLTKGRPGLGQSLFIGCAECGSPLPVDEVIASPHPRCHGCGTINDMYVSPTTVTSPVL